MTFKRNFFIKKFLLFIFVIFFIITLQYFLYKSDFFPLPEKNLFLFFVLQIDFILLLLLLYLIFRYLYKIFWSISGRKISRSLKFKLFMVYFLSISFTAIILVAGSLFFLKEGMDYWFKEFSALKISTHLLKREDWLKDLEADLLSKALEIREKYIEKTDKIQSSDLREKYRYFMGLDSIEVFTLQGELYKKTYSSYITTKPGISPSIIENLLKEKKSQSLIQPINSHLLVRVFLLVNDKTGKPYILAVGKIFDPNKLSEFTKDEKKISKSFQVFLIASLSLLFLLVLFIGIWVGNKLGKTLTEPLQTLILATQKISHRDYRLDDLPLKNFQEDEISQLIQAFKKMAEEIKRYETALRKYNQYLRGVLNSLPEGILILKEKGEILFANDQFNHFLSTFNFKNYQEFCEELSIDTYFDNLEIEQSFYKTITLSKAGREIHLGITFMKLELLNEILKLLIIENLEEKETLKRLSLWREVAVMLAHEIKNPLTPIKLSVERLQRKLREDLPQEKREFLEKTVSLINKYVEELKKLAYDLYYFSNKQVPEKEKLSVIENLEEVAELYRSAYPDLHINLIGSKETKIWADPFQLKRIWINLFENSLKAMNEKGKIEVKIVEKEDKVSIIYEDSGFGLEEEIIRAFNKGDPSDLKKIGTGLLVISSIMKLHGGRILAENREEGGSRFILEFPKELTS